MNSKNIKKSLKKKLDDLISHIEDEEIQKEIKQNAIITGGAIVSLLNSETPNDYDVYFKSYASLLKVAKYYAKQWNELHPDKNRVEIKKEKLHGEERITCFIRSTGVAIEENENGIDDESEPIYDGEPDVEEPQETEKPKYRPRYFTTNAISLSDKIQIVVRFYGPVDEIHRNYDFAHCTCSYDYLENKVDLPVKALECIINKELYYIGSKYPLCSIIRARKFITRGWHINAGQYLKMCLQLNELDLHDFDTFRDQLTGVDSAYFENAMKGIEKKLKENPDFKLENNYLFEVINRIF